MNNQDYPETPEHRWSRSFIPIFRRTMANLLIFLSIHGPRQLNIVMDYLTHGWSASEVCRQHAYLNRAEVHAALTYYYDCKDEIDDEIRDEWDLAKSDRQEATLPMFIADLQSAG